MRDGALRDVGRSERWGAGDAHREPRPIHEVMTDLCSPCALQRTPTPRARISREVFGVQFLVGTGTRGSALSSPPSRQQTYASADDLLLTQFRLTAWRKFRGPGASSQRSTLRLVVLR